VAKDAYAKFSALKLWTDADLKKQFAKSLDEANVSFQEASECLGQILILTKGHPTSSKIYNANTRILPQRSHLLTKV
jgi:hypothetical protein